MPKTQSYPASGDYKPTPDRTRTNYQCSDEPLKLKGPGYKVWRPEELKHMSADSFKTSAKIPEGSEKTWPGGGSAGIVDRLPEGTKKSLGIKGSNRLG